MYSALKSTRNDRPRSLNSLPQSMHAQRVHRNERLYITSSVSQQRTLAAFLVRVWLSCPQLYSTLYCYSCSSGRKWSHYFLSAQGVPLSKHTLEKVKGADFLNPIHYRKISILERCQRGETTVQKAKDLNVRPRDSQTIKPSFICTIEHPPAEQFHNFR